MQVRAEATTAHSNHRQPTDLRKTINNNNRRSSQQRTRASKQHSTTSTSTSTATTAVNVQVAAPVRRMSALWLHQSRSLAGKGGAGGNVVVAVPLAAIRAGNSQESTKSDSISIDFQIELPVL